MAHPIGNLERIRALAASARLLAVGGVRARTSSQIVLYDSSSEKAERTVDLPSHVLALASTDDAFIAACADGHVRIINKGDGKIAHDIAAHTGSANAVCVVGDSFATAGSDGALRVFSLAGKKKNEWTLSPRPLRACAISPEGDAFAAAGDDGVVRVTWPARKEDALRAMSGHDGGVTALAFTPADGRLVSGGEDGSVRIWYLAGDVEADVRGKDDSGHAGGVTAIVFIPARDETEIGERFATAGYDGKVRVWRMSERRKPKTIEIGVDAIHALAFAPKKSPNVIGTLFAGGDSRSVFAIPCDLHGAPLDEKTKYAHGFDVFAEALGASASARRDAAVKSLAELEETEATALAIRALGSDRDPVIRALAATELAKHGRRDARKALRERLDDDQAPVRAAALAALRKLEEDAPLAPLRSALESKFPDAREAAVGALAPLVPTSPLAAGLIASAVADGDAKVRRAAVAALVAIHPKASPEPLRVAFDRGTPDVRAEALLRGATSKLEKSPGFAPLVGKALDDEDADVRRIAYVVTVLEQAALVAWLEAKDEAFVRAMHDVYRRIREIEGGKTGEPSDAESKAIRARLTDASGAPAALDEKQREPLLALLACRTADTSLRGARGLALLGDMRALGALLTISRDADPDLRRDSARALAALNDPRAKRRLVWMLNDADPRVRDVAFECTKALEPNALALAQAALRGSEEDVRVRGLDVLVKQGKDAEGAEPLLGDSLEDESPKVRGEAFRTLWAWHTKDPLIVIDRALTGRFPDLRMRAVTELDTRAKKGDAPSLERLAKSIGDRDDGVAMAAYEATQKIKGDKDDVTHLTGIASSHPRLRARGAKDAAKAPIDKVRSALMKLLEDIDVVVRTTALESLDALLPSEPGPLHVGLQSSFLDLRVRAAELLATRRDDQLVNPMQALIADKELLKRQPEIAPLRQRGAVALASLGSPKLLRYFATELIKDDDPLVREQAARGVSNGSRRGEEGYLLDLLGHVEVAVRSWAAEGLARLGDARALPVLTGTLRHEHPPIRVGAVLSFAALGPEGYGGMLQGLEDPSRDVQRIVLSIVLARDLRAFRKQEAPELLTSALSSERPEVRFAAARALELRMDPASYLEHLASVLMPDKPEKAEAMEKWPPEETRYRLMVGLAEALAGDRPEQRYAAAQALRLRDRPVEYFREAQRATSLRSTAAPWVPETTPRRAEPAEAGKGPLQLLRKLFAGGADSPSDAPEGAIPAVANEEQRRLRLLAFGAYVGLLRQATTGDDDGHRTRRDAIDRIVELAHDKHVSVASATPALARALDDPHHLVRKAAFAALQRAYADDKETPLTLALASSAADVVKAALDELAGRGESGRPRIVRALDSNVPEARKYAFELLEKTSPKGSAEPLLAALESQHTDVRIGVLERLATSQDRRVAAALGKALESDHDDLRLRAAELLAARKDDRAADVLQGSLRSDDEAVAARARAALVKLGSAAAVRVLAARFEDQIPDPARIAIVTALGETKSAAAIDALVSRFADESDAVKNAAVEAVQVIAGPRTDVERVRGAPLPKPRNHAALFKALEAASHARAPSVRLFAAQELDEVDGPADAIEALLVALFGDRDRAVRVAAVTSYARRVEKKKAPSEPLEAVMHQGARDTLLPAAEGLAGRGVAASFRALLLVARAGEAGDRERALIALGTLGDKRALAELEEIAGGGTEEAPAELPMQAAALEALGRMWKKLEAEEQREGVRDRIESTVGSQVPEKAVAALRALRWMGGERARSRLEGALLEGSSSEDERRMAAKLLGEICDAASEKALAQALRDDDADVRWNAQNALMKIFPNERTRVEFHAVESPYEDVSGPAASFLADEGDAALLLAKLGALRNASLSERIRFGLVRRESVPTADIVKLLAADATSARSDAAWLAGARQVPDADRAALAKALVDAARKAKTKFEETKKKGDDTDDEEDAWAHAAWAVRNVDVSAFQTDAKKLATSNDVPTAVRVEAALACVGDSHLKSALADPDLEVRTAAASAMAGADPIALKQTPLDPVTLALVAKSVPKNALAHDEGRKVFLSHVLRTRDVAELAKLAADGKGQDRLDAIDALSRAPCTESDEALRAIAFEDEETEEVRRAAYKSLRRMMRLRAAEKRIAEAKEKTS
jgi:ParB family chromosome partitioning protein